MMLTDLATTLHELCGGMPLMEGATLSLILIPFISAAFLGSFAHCVWMCGPLVVMQTTQRLAPVPAHKLTEMKRLQGAALLPYHAGRATTYTVLGMAAGGLGNGLTHIWQPFAAVLLFWAGILLIFSTRQGQNGAFTRKNSALRSIIRHLKATTWCKNMYSKRIRPLFLQPTGGKGYVLGCFLGLLPCGLVYAALAAAAGTGSILNGGILLFTLAVCTFPALLFIGFLSALGVENMRHLKHTMKKLAQVMTLLAGTWLCVLAAGLLLISLYSNV